RFSRAPIPVTKLQQHDLTGDATLPEHSGGGRHEGTDMATEKTVATVKPTKVQPAAPPQRSGDGGLQRAMKYLREVNTELKKTTWPSREELIAQTQVVIGVLLLIGIFIAVWDTILGKVFQGLMALLGVKT